MGIRDKWGFETLREGNKRKLVCIFGKLARSWNKGWYLVDKNGINYLKKLHFSPEKNKNYEKNIFL